MFGNKIQDAPVVNDELDVSQSGQTGDIRIIRVVVNGENVSKIIVILMPGDSLSIKASPAQKTPHIKA